MATAPPDEAVGESIGGTANGSSAVLRGRFLGALDGMRHEVNIRVPSALEAPAHRERSPVMMMQHDTGPMPPNVLAHETVDAVRRALQRYVVAASAIDAASTLRTALQGLAHEARGKHIPPEQLLVTLKSIWQALPEVENARDHNEKTRILQRIVTICIQEYFAE